MLISVQTKTKPKMSQGPLFDSFNELGDYFVYHWGTQRSLIGGA